MASVATTTEGGGATALAPAPINRTNLIVNYLPQNFTDADFSDLFNTVGKVTASKVIRDRASGYSYGFGFIDYATEEEAAQAIETLNGYALDHKRIKVSYARQGENVKGANLYIRHLPKEVGESDLEALFGSYGHIVQVRVLTDAAGQSRGVGFVLFSTREQAQIALSAIDGTTPPGYPAPISVKFAEDNKLKMRPDPMSPISATNVPLCYGGGRFGVPPYGVGGVGGGMNFARGVGPMRNQMRARFNPLGPGAMGGVPFIGGDWGMGGMGGMMGGGYVLFVFNIGADTDEFALWQMFSPFGAVQKVAVVRDKEKKTGKGYAFVTMCNYSEAVGAIHGLNGQELGGQRLQVSFKK